MTKNKITMNLHKIGLWSVFVLMLCACNSHSVYEKYQSISPMAWDMNEPAHFEVEMTDTVGKYDVILHIRNNDMYPYQNIWLFTQSTAPDSTIATDTLSCYLADNQGKWINDAFLSEHDMPLVYMSHIRFPKAGTYTFTIAHGMRDSLLTGISRIGLSIEPTNMNANVEK